MFLRGGGSNLWVSSLEGSFLLENLLVRFCWKNWIFGEGESGWSFLTKFPWSFCLENLYETAECCLHLCYWLESLPTLLLVEKPRHTPLKTNMSPKRDYFSREYIFQPLIFRGHVSFQGSKCSNPHVVSFRTLLDTFDSFLPLVSLAIYEAVACTTRNTRFPPQQSFLMNAAISFLSQMVPKKLIKEKHSFHYISPPLNPRKLTSLPRTGAISKGKPDRLPTTMFQGDMLAFGGEVSP